MVVFGGYVHQHHLYETCYGTDTWVYDLECNTWIQLSPEWVAFVPLPTTRVLLFGWTSLVRACVATVV
jgi:hypothetical protein